MPAAGDYDAGARENRRGEHRRAAGGGGGNEVSGAQRDIGEQPYGRRAEAEGGRNKSDAESGECAGRNRYKAMGSDTGERRRNAWIE